MVALATGLQQRGFDVTVGVFYAGGAFERHLKDAGVRLLSFDKRGRWDVFGFLFRVVAAIRKARPDALYCFLGPANLLGTLVRPFIPGTRLIWSVRSSNVELDTYDWLARLSYRIECALAGSADAIICNSAAGLEHVAADGFPRSKMIVIPNGIDTDAFQPDPEARAAIRQGWGVGADEKLIGVLARLDPMKDHATFLHAARTIADARSDVRFACIGDGTEQNRTELAQLADRLGIADRVIWSDGSLGAANALNALDICCSSSAFGEGFSNSVAEAMACGLPCVVTDVGDSAFLVGDTGRVVRPRDASGLAAALLATLDTLHDGAGSRARFRIVEHFSIERLVQTTADALI